MLPETGSFTGSFYCGLCIWGIASEINTCDLYILELPEDLLFATLPMPLKLAPLHIMILENQFLKLLANFEISNLPQLCWGKHSNSNPKYFLFLTVYYFAGKELEIPDFGSLDEIDRNRIGFFYLSIL